MENEEILSDVLKWVESQIANKKYCDMSVSFSVHNGKISKLQKSLTEKFIAGGGKNQ